MTTSFFTPSTLPRKMHGMRALSLLLLACVFTTVSVSARAQDAALPPLTKQEAAVPTLKDTLPVEVAMMYQKLLKQQPDYNALIAANSSIQNDPTRFGNDVLMKQQINALKKIYDGFSPNSVFLVKKRVTVTQVDSEKSLVVISDLTPDEPFLFDLTATDSYAIFLRNAKDVSVLNGPYVYDEFRWLVGYKTTGQTYPAEIVVRPLAADTAPFILPDGRSVKPLVADVVEITLLGTNGQQIAVKKRFNNWNPDAPSSPLMELKDAPPVNTLPN